MNVLEDGEVPCAFAICTHCGLLNLHGNRCVIRNTSFGNDTLTSRQGILLALGTNDWI